MCLAADSFKLDTGRYPTESEGLEILLPDGGGFSTPPTAKPKGYLKNIPIDPWSRPYTYIAVNTDYRILTYGADGVPGGMGDDEDVIGCDSFYTHR
jgi:general secretion pathway protein G